MLPYNRRDYNAIYEYLKEKAQELSKGRWTDWSEGDIGAVLIHLMSYLGDMNNYQIDATGAELFLNTALERSSLMEITKLTGYEPKHFMSAYCEVTLGFPQLVQVEQLIYENTMMSTADEQLIYSTLEDYKLVNGTVKLMMYEGKPTVRSFEYSSITSDGKIFLPDYEVGFNTVRVRINNLNNNEPLPRVRDVRFISGEMGYSLHVSLDEKVYIQLPSFWKDIIDPASIIKVSYNISSGSAGTIGENQLKKFYKSSDYSAKFDVYNAASMGGTDPESIEEIRKWAPIAARTMYTIVTKKDFDDVAIFVPNTAQTKSFDYLDGEPPTRNKFPFYAQPDDYYKVLMLAVPSDKKLNSIFKEEFSDRKYFGPKYDADYIQELKMFNSVGEELVKYIDERRLASLKVTYSDPEYILPSVELDIYMDKNDLRINSIALDVVTYIKIRFGRGNVAIGESIYGSVIGKEVLNYFPQVDYLEVQAPEHNIPAEPWEYIDMANAEFVVRVNDEKVELPSLYDDMRRFELVEGEKIVIYNPKTEKTEEIYWFSQQDYLANPSIIPEEIKAAFVMKYTILYVPDEYIINEGGQ